MSVIFETRKSAEPIVGIDLGTTNSLVAFVRDGKPEVLEARDGGHLIPSVVSFAGDKEPVVGLQAKREKIRDAGHTVSSAKRLLGRGFEDLKQLSGTLPYELVPSASGVAKIRAGGREVTAIEVSAIILREIKASAERALGQPVTKAVVTVPAYFNDSQRQATRAAGRLAGLDVLRIVNEPTAAALAYGLDRKKQGLIAVFDLGGGTFDVSILKLHDGIFEVLATNGDTALGGDDLDLALARVAASELGRAWGVDPWGAVEIRSALLEAAERTKIALSSDERAELVVELSGRRFAREFTRAEFEAMALRILERTREPCLAALKDAGLDRTELSDVVLVGGPTRLGIVQRVAREIFGREPNTSVHPDEVVAVGAAIQADILAGNNRELLLLDVVPLSLGIETYGGLMSPLIHRNTRVPAVVRETFTTFVDNQTGVDIHVLQGERDRAEDNRSLARFKLAGIQPQPAGLPRVEVSFLIDADGILQVAARDAKTGSEQSVEVRPSFGLSEVEIQRMLAASAEHAQEDIDFKRLVEARNEAEPVLRASEKALNDAALLLPETEAVGIRTDVEALRNAMAGKDLEAIKGASYKLGSSTTKLAELLLTHSLKRAQASNNTSSPRS